MQGVLIGLRKMQVIQNEGTFFAKKIMKKKKKFCYVLINLLD